MKHRKLTVLLLCAALLLLAAAPSLAALMTLGVRSMNSTLTISTAGTASCSATFDMKPGFKADVVLELIQVDGGTETTVASWTKSGSIIVKTNGTYDVDSGYTYYTKATANVYTTGGTWVEEVSTSSATSSY